MSKKVGRSYWKKVKVRPQKVTQQSRTSRATHVFWAIFRMTIDSDGDLPYGVIQLDLCHRVRSNKAQYSNQYFCIKSTCFWQQNFLRIPNMSLVVFYGLWNSQKLQVRKWRHTIFARCLYETPKLVFFNLTRVREDVVLWNIRSYYFLNVYCIFLKSLSLKFSI